MSSVRLTKKPVTVNGASVSDLLYLFKYNAKGLPDWVVRAHNEGTLIFADQTLTINIAESRRTVDYRWWLLEHPGGRLEFLPADAVWDNYDKEVK